MGDVIGTCGHKLSERWLKSRRGLVHWKEYTIDYDVEKLVHAVAYGEVCPKCKRNYKKWGILLENREEQDLWLAGEVE